MRKIVLIACLIFTILPLQGCSTSYEKNTEPGVIKKITLAQMEEMMEKKESFAIMFTQTTCMSCQEFQVALDEYTKDHHIVMYDVVLDLEMSTQEENLSIIEQYFKGFYSTPGIFYVEDGESKSQLKGSSIKGITEEMLDEWVTKNQVDAI